MTNYKSQLTLIIIGLFLTFGSIFGLVSATKVRANAYGQCNYGSGTEQNSLCVASDNTETTTTVPPVITTDTDNNTDLPVTTSSTTGFNWWLLAIIILILVIGLLWLFGFRRRQRNS